MLLSVYCFFSPCSYSAFAFSPLHIIYNPFFFFSFNMRRALNSQNIKSVTNFRASYGVLAHSSVLTSVPPAATTLTCRKSSTQAGSPARHRGLATFSQPQTASNPQMAFPCLDRLEKRTESLQSSYDSGPEPDYSNVSTGYSRFQSKEPLFLDNGVFFRNLILPTKLGVR